MPKPSLSKSTTTCSSNRLEGDMLCGDVRTSKAVKAKARGSGLDCDSGVRVDVDVDANGDACVIISRSPVLTTFRRSDGDLIRTKQQDLSRRARNQNRSNNTHTSSDLAPTAPAITRVCLRVRTIAAARERSWSCRSPMLAFEVRLVCSVWL